jgi:hypothetical protein
VPTINTIASPQVHFDVQQPLRLIHLAQFA